MSFTHFFIVFKYIRLINFIYGSYTVTGNAIPVSDGEMSFTTSGVLQPDRTLVNELNFYDSDNSSTDVSAWLLSFNIE